MLDVLSGYRITNTQGAVYLNGRIRNLEQFRKMSCYIQQEDRLQMLLTVLENMRIAADLKLSTNIPAYEKETIVRIMSYIRRIKKRFNKKTTFTDRRHPNSSRIV